MLFFRDNNRIFANFQLLKVDLHACGSYNDEVRLFALSRDSYVSKKVERVQNWHFNLSLLRGRDMTLFLPRSKEN